MFSELRPMVRGAAMAAVVVAGMVASVAQASTLTVTVTGSEPSSASVTRTILTGPGAPQTNAALTVERFTAINNGGTFMTPLVGNGVAGQFYAFCIEPRQFINTNVATVYDVVSLQLGATNLGGMGATKADQIAELFGRFAPNLNAPMTSLVAGALQISIWEIVRELPTNALDVNVGNISFAAPESISGMVALAQSYVTAINGLGPRAQGLLALNNGPMGNVDPNSGWQDLLVQQVPEPGSLLVLATAVLGLVGVRRKGRASF